MNKSLLGIFSTLFLFYTVFLTQPVLGNEPPRPFASIFLPEKAGPELTLDQNTLWKKQKKNSVYLAPDEGNSWVKITLSNPHKKPITRYIELATTEIPSVQAYQRTHDSNSFELSPIGKPLGSQHRFSSREIDYRHIVYPITVDANGSEEIFLNLKHPFSVKLNVKFWSPERFTKYISQELIFFGMIYGALFMIITYNIFIYLSLREKNHLLFVLFGSFTGLFISMQEGHFSQFIAPDMIWAKDILYAVICALMSFCFTFFSIYFLDIERWSMLLMRLLLAFGSITALFLLLLGVSPTPIVFSHYTLLLIITLYAFAIGLGLFIWHRNISSAGFFSLAIFLSAIGLLVEFCSHLPFISLSKINYGYVSLGNTAMILVFAFALADKMRVLSAEKLDASHKLVKLTEEKAQSNLEIFKTKLHEVELEKEASEARIESRAKSEFLATMSHEIRTPMNGVLGMTELLEDTNLDSKQQHYVASIGNSAKALLNVINDLLDYSKIESGKMEFDARVYNLEKILDDCISLFSLTASEAKINFIGCIEPGTPVQFKGDPEKLRQIILNLLSNAFSFTSNGDIFLNISSKEKSTVNCEEILVEIVCKNIILSDEEKESLFTPFKEGQIKKHHGHELGLTVSKQLVELMQGEIGVETDPEENSTTLWFTSRQILPHKNELKELDDREKILGGRRVLICDTSEEFIKSVKKMTESWGMETNSSTSSKDAITILHDDELAYQVLMISEELLTPEVQLAVRQSNVDHNFITSIILTTRTRFALTNEEMKKQGIQFILEKPYTIKHLYKSLLRSMGLEARKSEKEDTPQFNIMIVEDNNVNLMVLDGLIKKLGYHPITASNGVEALEKYNNSSSNLDLVFMDCEMPEMDGYEATQEIRKTEHGDSTIIIGLSAHSTPEYKDQAKTAGMDDFLVKPINREEISSLIDNIISGSFSSSFEQTQILEDTDTDTDTEDQD